MAVGEWVVPAQLDLVDDELRWTRLGRHKSKRGEAVWADLLDVFREQAAGSRTAPIPDAAFLVDFCKLVNAPAERIRRFAHKWGLIGVCQHDLPSSHDPRCEPRQDETTIYEPIAAWRRLARLMASALSVGVGLADRPARRGLRADWEVICAPTPDGLGMTPFLGGVGDEHLGRVGASAQSDRLAFAQVITALIDLAGVHPTFSWGQRTTLPTFELVGGSLFGALVVQLACSVARTSGVHRCSSCTAFFTRDGYRPRPGQRRYCDDCRASGNPGRDADADRRERNRRERTRRGDG